MYVVNDGGSGGIAGFRFDGGQLEPISGSQQPLSSGASQPAQISLTPDARSLVVTEKGTNRITTYAVGADGAAGAPQFVTSAGETPFGFAFDKRGHLIVSEAFGGAPDASTVSSYAVTSAGSELIDGPVATTETAACWVLVTGNGKYAYATNTGSGTLSGYAIGNDGSLTLLDANGVTGVSGGSPTDLSRSANSKFVYVRTGGSLVTFVIGSHGDLTNLGTTAVGAGIVGLASS
ncbi:MAG: beta-propeller fold lactonase family protein [Candidatus Limnocylindria bacterium]